jgi:hypothetical protein
MLDHKSTEQRNFETRVRDAEIKVATYLPDQLELIDLIARDLFCSGHPQGWSAADQRHWDDLDDVPVFTRGQTTHPAKLQWRIKAIRIMDILDDWMKAQAGKARTDTVN